MLLAFAAGTGAAGERVIATLGGRNPEMAAVAAPASSDGGSG